MNKYKGFYVAEYVKLTAPVFCNGTNFYIGDIFRIISFPPCTIPGKHTHFVYGRDNEGNPIRVEIDDICKTTQ